MNTRNKALLLMVALALIAPASTRSATVTYNCNQLGSFVDSGGQQEKTAVWKIGAAPGYERTFRINWDMYGIPDNMTVKWLSPTGKMSYSTGNVSYNGSYLLTLSARGDQTVTITVNSGGGLSGTAWQYTLMEDGANVRDITLSAYAGSTPHRRILSGTNLAADVSLDFSNPSVIAGTGATALIPSVYRVVIPSNARAFRVKAPAGVYLAVKKGCIPKPGENVPGQSSRNMRESNVVSFDDLGAAPAAGTYYITAAMPYFSLVFGGPSAGTMEVDCFLGGYWAQATYRPSSTREMQRILVGVEGQGNPSLPASGALLTLVSHGRVNSPLDRLAVGNAAANQWGSYVRYINWSEGSYANTFGGAWLDGARFITSAGPQIARILRKHSFKTPSTVDFIGHSWGTYMGWSVSRGFGRFQRFFALDPAFTATNFPSGSVNFLSTARYAMAIWGGGIYGSETLACRAHDSVYLQSSAILPGALHEEPVTVMTAILNNTVPAYVQNAFAWNCGPVSVTAAARPWLANKYPLRVLAGPGGFPLFYRGKFEVQLDTNGSGGVTALRYQDKLAKTEVLQQ